ncbi:MAG: LysR family transcriptional regulator, partial [Pseudomonadota bacterium]
MDRDWNDVKAFSEVAQAGSLTEAARRSGISIATLSRRLEQIERAMGLQLVRRSPAGAELTEDGKALLPAVQEAHDAMDTVLRLSRVLKDRETALPVRISATETVITTLLAPALKGLEVKRDRPAIDFVVSTENADLSKREAEMAIRLAAPALDTLHARRLGTVASSLYTAPKYPAVGSEDAQAFLSQDFVLYDERFGDIPEVIWARNQGIANRAVMLS